MANKSMGQFIAALRRANGMTQQDMADRLNVSNKAISRWERDESAPDITLIPAIAEMFGVTCDELLKGERIMDSAPAEKREARVEKQVQSLINRTLSGFRTLVWISLAVSVVGLICMFGISYGFFRPVIGFAVMLLFEACAFVIAVLAVNRTKDVKTDNELFDEAGEKQKERFNKCFGSLSFSAFFVIFTVILLSVPLIMYRGSYVQSVLSFGSYIVYYLPEVLIVLLLVYLVAKKPYISWITDQTAAQIRVHDTDIRRMTVLQLGAVVIAGVLFVVSPYFESKPHQTSPVCIAINILGLLFLAADILCFAVFMVKHKEDRQKLILPGVRNMILIVSGLLISGAHNIGFSSVGTSTLTYMDRVEESWAKYDIWDAEYFYYSIGFALLTFVVFEIIKRVRGRRTKNV